MLRCTPVLLLVSAGTLLLCCLAMLLPLLALQLRTVLDCFVNLHTLH
jgi:hypothetical protein